MTETETRPTPVDIDLPPHGGGSLQIRESDGLIVKMPADHDQMLDIIDRASRDPSVDIVKFRELMNMRREFEDRIAEREFDVAMSVAQSKMEQVRTDCENQQTHSRYASYAALDKPLRPIYTQHGFSLSYNTEPSAAPEEVVVICRVSKMGHSRNYRIVIPADGKGAKGGDVMTKTHATVSAVSYGKRVLLGMIWNIAIARDDDGNAAGAITISEEQHNDLMTLITDINGDFEKAGSNITVDVKKICERAKVTSLESFPAKKYEPLVASLKQWAQTTIATLDKKKASR